MKSSLTPFVAPVVEKPVCRACGTFSPDCLVPVDEGALPMCWLCAHHVVDHGSAVSAAHVGECECSLEEIYPPHVLNARRGLLGNASAAASARC